MESFTVLPVDLVHYFRTGGFILMGGFFLIWITKSEQNLRDRGDRPCRLYGFAVLILFVFAVTNNVIGCHMDARIIYEKNFAELPSQWREFHHFLGTVQDARLRGVVIQIFLYKNPPKITVNGYSALVGSDLLRSQASDAHKSFRCSDKLPNYVSFGLVEKG